MNLYADLTTLKSKAYIDYEGTDMDTYFLKLLEDASRVIDDYCLRHFYCWEGKKYYDGAGSKLFVDDLLSITTLKCDPGGDGVFENTYTANTDYLLYPLNGYPKRRIDLGYSANYSDFAGEIPRGVEIDGVHGFGDGRSVTPYTATAITGTVATTTGTSITLSAEGTIKAGQTIRIESEQMYVSAVSSDDSKTATVERGANGTTAATHSAKTISVYQYPAPIYESCLILAMRAWKRKDSAYQDVVGYESLGTLVISKGNDPDVVERLKPYIKFRKAFA